MRAQQFTVSERSIEKNHSQPKTKEDEDKENGKHSIFTTLYGIHLEIISCRFSQFLNVLG